MKDVKAAVSSLNLSASEDSDDFRAVERKFLGAFKCFMEFNETQDQARLQVRYYPSPPPSEWGARRCNRERD